MLQVRAALRRLPVRVPPAALTTSLRVLASRESARRAASLGRQTVLGLWALRTRLWAGDMMRPLALPMAGGLISALVLFSLLVPPVMSRTPSVVADVPTELSTEATFVSMGPFGFGEDNAIEVDVTVTVNQHGRVVDYSAPSGQRWMKNPQMRRSVENALLFMVFTPGTTFWQPTSGKVRLTLRRSEIEVKG
jgi:hypothetical protein